MKYTLADCIEKINQVLNYPSVDYSDISHFFDQAIAELNTELHIGIRPISELYKKSIFNIEKLGDFIFLDEEPKANVSTDLDANPHIAQDENGTYKIFYKKHPSDEEFITTYTLYGVYANYVTNEVTGAKEISRQIYQTVTLGGHAYWTPYEFMPDRELNLLEYLPYDWVVLFLIPYVCFKYAVRNGDSGTLYAEEFQQGFMQLNKSYEVPCFAILSEQAGKTAYLTDVEENLPTLNIYVPTRAIYESMKVARVAQAKHGGTMYDTGGWGI
jgi:hypothetical protein